MPQHSARRRAARAGTLRTAGLGALLLFGAAVFCRSAAAAPCAGLSVALPGHGSITAEQAVPAGSYRAGDGVTYTDLPAFCRIDATLRPTADSDIRIEIWMPSESNVWNGRFVGTGNGGYAGSIVYSELAATLSLGFAVINTDMGTSPATVLDGKPPTGHPQQQIDFAYRSTHLMTLAGKAIVRAFYGRDPNHSFFTGCSTGGGQALHEAEQFPADYDGIVGGAPAENRTNLHVSILWEYAVTHLIPNAVISETLLQTVTDSVVAACGVQSGSLPSDRFLTDPRTCRWNAFSLLCKPGQTADCLNPQQAIALELIYAGPHDLRTGQLIYPGVNRGSEAGSLFDIAAEEGLSFGQTEPTFDGLFYWVFGPDWKWQSFDYDRDVATLDATLGPIANANSTDLSAFRARGGKFIMYHGWADALVPPQDDIDYFLRLASTQDGASADASSGVKRAQRFFRLFMAPGMGHCETGPGPNVFGGADNPGGPADAKHNVLLSLQRWVETGDAPERIVATKYPLDDQTRPPAMTRPLCVFPKVARYKGSGDSNSADNFACANDHVTDDPVAPPPYRQ